MGRTSGSDCTIGSGCGRGIGYEDGLIGMGVRRKELEKNLGKWPGSF